MVSCCLPYSRKLRIMSRRRTKGDKFVIRNHILQGTCKAKSEIEWIPLIRRNAVRISDTSSGNRCEEKIVLSSCVIL